jgi:GTP-binding protein
MKWKGPYFTISAMKSDGCKELTFAIMDHLDAVRAAAAAANAT